MRRLFWMAVGAAATVKTLQEARELADRHVPAGARTALGAAAGLTTVAQRAAAEFRRATAEREAELRSDLLAGADLTRSRARVDAWRAERAAAGGDATAAGATSTRARGTRPAAHRPEDPDDGALGYSFF